jgi:hypothetical protein
MFKWACEYSIEADISLQTAWDFYANPINWPKWEERLDVCSLEGEFKTGAKVKVKIKNKPVQFSILITEVKPFHEYRTLVNVLFTSQESLTIFQAISPTQTRITQKVFVNSLFTPFMRSTLRKNMEKGRLKYIQAVAQLQG